MNEDTVEISKYIYHLTKELERISGCLVSIKDDIADVRKDFNNFKIEQAKEVTQLKVKSGLWAAAGTTLIILLGWFLQTKLQ